MYAEKLRRNGETMKEILVRANEAGQRLDKLLAKVMPQAPKSFLYKMLRKKNITLNDKKAEGSEKLVPGDTVRLWLSEETLEKFGGGITVFPAHKESGKLPPLDILYEDNHVLILNKAPGVLSQKAKSEDISVVEQVIAYEMERGRATETSLQTFRPSVCNRLDRNTSGILIAGVSLVGLQTMSALLKERSLHKYYYCLVTGHVSEKQYVEGYLTKNEKNNRVSITKNPTGPDAQMIKTAYEPVDSNGKVTLLRVLLITGRSHQIRAHLASEGHPIVGDEKYGNRERNAGYRKQYGLTSQLLHAFRLEIPEITGELSYLSGKVIEAPLPILFRTILEGEGICFHNW